MQSALWRTLEKITGPGDADDVPVSSIWADQVSF
jgi:hypothetical protein